MHVVAEILLLVLIFTTVNCATRITEKYIRSDNATQNYRVLDAWVSIPIHPTNYLCTQGLPGVTSTCESDLRIYCETLQENRPATWALKMLDSSTKIPEGILSGHLQHLGNFDECLSVQRADSGAGAPFDSRHCLVTFSQGEQAPRGRTLNWAAGLLSQLGDPGGAALEVAWCVPASCGPQDLLAFAAAAVVVQGAEKTTSGFAVAVPANKCHTRARPPLKDVDIAALCILGFFILPIIASTAYDAITIEKGYRPPVLTSFSVLSNAPKLVATTSDGDKLHAVNGIRSLSVAWVVLGNTLLYYCSQVPSINAFYFHDYVRDPKRMGIVNTHVAIDTLLLTSGLLVCFKFLNEVEKKGTFKVLKFYINHYLKATLPLGVMVLLTLSLLNHAGTGPLWDSRHDELRERCEANWWTTLLYVSNYVHPNNRCLTQSWFLSVDMQLYWLSPLVLTPLWKRPRLAKIWIAVLFLAGLASPFCIVYLMKISASSRIKSSEDEEKYIKYYHVPTHTRFSVWLVGIVLGFVLHQERKTKRKKLSWIAVASGWAVAMVLLLVSAHLQYPFQRDNYRYDPLEAAFYLTLHKPAWALGVAWVIYACDRGHGGIIGALLSSNFFRPVARLSYGIYLTHISVIHLMGGSTRTPIYLSDLTMINVFIGVLVMSIAWTLPLALLFQAPFIALEKALFEKEDEDASADLPQSLETPMPFKMPSQLKRLPEMSQINDDAEAPNDDEVLDERL